MNRTLLFATTVQDVCKAYWVDAQDLLGRDRCAQLAEARRALYRRLAALGMTDGEIAKRTGRERSTISSVVRRRS